MNDIGLFTWIGLAFAVLVIVALVNLMIKFFKDYYGTWYEYVGPNEEKRGMRYRLLKTIDCKDRTTRVWYSAALYKNKHGQIFCRPMEEFHKRFVPVKRK